MDRTTGISMRSGVGAGVGAAEVAAGVGASVAAVVGAGVGVAGGGVAVSASRTCTSVTCEGPAMQQQRGHDIV